MPNSTNKGRQFPHWKMYTVEQPFGERSFYVDGEYKAVVFKRMGDESPWPWKVYHNEIIFHWGMEYNLRIAKYRAEQSIEYMKSRRSNL